MNLNQVTVATADVARAVDYYQRLGLRLIVEALPTYARFECPNGGSTFSVHLSDTPVTPSQTVVYFECDDLDQRVHALQQAGIAFETQPADQTWLWREARLRDPDGNPICLFHAGRNRLDPPWRVNRV